MIKQQSVMKAVQRNRIEVVKLLLAHKDIDVNYENKSGYTAYDHALEFID